MNNIIENMLYRRSVRDYQTRQISDEELKIILECGLYAPTGGNCQFSRFIVIQRPEVIEELNELIQAELAGKELKPGQWMNRGITRARQKGYHFIYHAPTLINGVSPRDHDNSMANCANALENMQLAAAALGIGACWSNQPHWLTDVPKIRAVFARFGLEENEDIFGSVSLGYPTHEDRSMPPRKSGRINLDIPRDIGL